MSDGVCSKTLDVEVVLNKVVVVVPDYSFNKLMYVFNVSESVNVPVIVGVVSHPHSANFSIVGSNDYFTIGRESGKIVIFDEEDFHWPIFC